MITTKRYGSHGLQWGKGYTMKTFYTVKHFSSWTGTTTEKWFDDRAKALAFYEAQEAADKPVAHTLRNEDRIRKITEGIREAEAREAYEQTLSEK